MTALTLVSLATPKSARAAVLTVAIGGSLQTAVNNATPGDVIRLAGNTQANETVDLGLMGSAVASSPGNLTIVGINGASATLLGGNNTRLTYSRPGAFPGTLTLSNLTFSTSASTPTPAVALQNMGSVFVVNSVFDGVGAEGCASGLSGCTGLYISAASGTPTIALYSNTFRNIASDEVVIDIQGTAQASVVVDTNLFTDNGLNTAVPNNGVSVSTSGSATAALTVAQSSFSNLSGQAISVSAGGTSAINASIDSNAITNMSGVNLGAITLLTEPAATSPTLNAIVSDNQMASLAANGVLAMLQSTGASPGMQVQVLRNTIDTVDSTSSKRGVLVLALPTYVSGGVRGSLEAKIEDNTISNTGGSGIRLEIDDVNAKASIRNNNLSNNNLIAGSDEAGISALVGSNNLTSNAYTLDTAIVGNTIGAAGVYLASATASSPLRVESTSAPAMYIAANNTFSGGGTVTTAGTIASIALNSVPRPADNQPPTASVDNVTAATGTSTVFDVLANDADLDLGDAVSLLSFQAVSARGAAIARDDNGTPANLADDRLQFTPLLTGAGTDILYYVARDNGGRTAVGRAIITVVNDTTPPDTTITANPTNPSASSNASFSFTGSDNITLPASLTFQCQLDGGAFAACTSPKTYTGLADGSHTVLVRAIDAVGLIDPTPASYTWTIDTTPPPAPVVITPANGGVTNNPLPAVTGTAEANSTVTVFIDGSSAGTTTADAAGNWAFTPSIPLSNGAHTVKSRAADAVGNSSVDSNTNTVTVDTVEPDTTFTATPPAATNSTSASFQFTGNGTGSAVASYQCSLDGAAFSVCTSPASLSGLSEGSHTFAVRAIDAAGNTETTPASSTWLVDLTAPDTTITASPPALSNSSSASFSFSGSDPGGSGVASYECQLDGGAFAACTSPKTYSGLSDGPHTFAVRAVDSAGNVDPTPASYTWTVDTTPPPAPVTLVPANGSATINPLPAVTGTAEPGGTVTVFINSTSVGTTTADGSGNWSFTPPSPLADGLYKVKARSADAAGNSSVDSNTNTFMVDTTAPDTTISANPTDPSNSASASFSFSGSDGGGSGVASFACQLDGGGFAPCASPQAYSGLSDGSHAFQVRAVDNAGNVDATPASYTWTVDTTAPDTTIDVSPADPSNSASASFSFSGSDSGSGVAVYECQLDGGGFVACTSPQPYTGLADGAHTFAVRAVDAAGNMDATPASVAWTIDTTAPGVTIALAAGQTDPSATAPIRFVVTFDEPVAGFDESDIDMSGSTAPGTLSASVSQIAPNDGTTYGVTVSGMTGPGTVVIAVGAGAASDAAGNPSQATKVGSSVTFSAAQPIVTGIARASANPTSASTVQFAVTFSEPVTGVDAGDFRLAASGLSGASISGLSGSGASYTVSVTTGAGSGTVGLSLVDDDSIRGSGSGIALGGSGTGNGDLNGEVYAIDRQAPTAGGLVASNITVAGAATYTLSLTLSDNLAIDIASVGDGDLRVSGPQGFSQAATLVSVSPAGSGTPRSATYQISAPGGSWDVADSGLYSVALVAGQIRDTAGNAAPAATLGTFQVDLGVKVYLPMLNSPALGPDLIVESIRTSGRLEVVIRNIGDQAVTDPFWVDLYLNPSPAPTAVNQIWPGLASQGATWGVTGSLLPIAPGAQLTLTVGDRAYRADLSTLPASIPAGTTLYAQADSANATPGVTYGAVLESHERLGGAYNNILGPLSPAAALPAGQSQAAALTDIGPLPPRSVAAPR